MMSFGHALYYPRINLTNKNWLKHAFLFWDKISRIVPASVQPQDDEDIIRMNCEADFIENHYVESWETSDTFRRFSELLEELIASEPFLRRYLGRHGSDFERRYMEDPEVRYNLFSEMTRHSGSYIHVEKLDRRTKELLYRHGLAAPDTEWSDWVRVDGEVGFAYMSCLAKTISRKASMSIVTDVGESFILSSNYGDSDLDYSRGQLASTLGNLLISAYIPKDINRLPIEKLIDFRRKYSSARFDYYEYVSSICKDMPKVDSQEALKDAMHHYASGLKGKCEELKRCYNDSSIETVKTFLAIAIPTKIVTSFKYFSEDIKALGYGIGIGFGVMGAMGKVRKERRALRKEPLSYLLNLEAEMAANNLFDRVSGFLSGVRRF